MSQPIETAPPAKKNWKTTAGGLIGMLGTAIVFIVPWLQGSQDPRLQALGGLLIALGFGGASVAARDNGVSDQQAGARPEPKQLDGIDPRRSQ